MQGQGPAVGSNGVISFVAHTHSVGIHLLYLLISDIHTLFSVPVYKYFVKI